MKTYYDCLPCLVRQAIEAVNMVTDDEALQEKVIRQVLLETARIDLKASPPHMARTIHQQIKETLGTTDPYKNIKDKFNQFAMKMYAKLKKQVRNSADPFETSLRLAIAGNIIDFGVRADIEEQHIEETIAECLKNPIVFNSPADLQKAIEAAEKILFLGDNAGEIVFDKLLIEQMPRDKISYVVKGFPIINDATMEDAIDTGMTDLVRVLDNGCDAPGTILELCSLEFQEEFRQADLIIAKGQGNYETLSGLQDKDIFFLLKVKCPVIAQDLGCESGDIVARRMEIV